MKMQLEDYIINRFRYWWNRGEKPNSRQLQTEERSVRKFIRKWDQICTEESVLKDESD